ncbi:hypothetical protein ACB092_12G214300 [Castanea dentata]
MQQCEEPDQGDAVPLPCIPNTIRDSISIKCIAVNTPSEFVMDVVDRLFVAMFDSLNNDFAKELEAMGRQYPFQPLKYLRQTLRLTYEEGIQMLKDGGVEVDPLGDLNTEAERKLGQLVLEKYDTETLVPFLYSGAVSIKMNVLLYAPSLLLLMLRVRIGAGACSVFYILRVVSIGLKVSWSSTIIML